MVPVVMRDVRNLWLPTYDDAEVMPANAGETTTARGVKRLLILPGLTYRPASELRRCGSLSKLNVRLSVQDPTALDLHDKRKLLRMTTSKDAIRRWREVEGDPEILSLMDTRLHGG